MPLPPGPRAPGALQTLYYGLHPFGFFARSRRRYGDLFTVRVTGQTWVVLTSPDLVKQTFGRGPAEVDSGIANRPIGPLIGRRNVLMLDGDEHLRRRKLVLPPFHGDRMRAYTPIVEEATRSELARWPMGRPRAVLPSMQAITLDVILRAVFGVEDAGRMDRLRAGVRRVMAWATGLRAAFVFGFLGHERLERTPAFRRHLEAVDAEVFAEIARRRDAPAGDDVLSLLLEARFEDGSGLSDRDLRDELVTLLVAGHETTTALLAWALHDLARSPADWERLAAGEEGWADAVVNETLRLHPPVPLVVRRLREPMRFDGYQLPAGATVAPCATVIHRDPAVWAEPDAFRPQRFVGTRAPAGTWLPFGGGVRRCLGAAFAQFEARTVLAELARTYHLGPGSRLREPVGRRGIVLVPARGGRVVLTPRS